MNAAAEAMIEEAIGVRPVRITPLSGGCVAQVWSAELPGGDRVVAKIDPGGDGGLEAEAFMLRYLAERTTLPTPRVRAASSTTLVMDLLPGSTGASGDAEEHAAELLAELHAISDARFGFERDTVIGGLPQPNPPSATWIDVFRTQRLLFMAQAAADAGTTADVELTVTNRDAFRGLVLTYLEHAEILEPAELRDAYAAAH